MEGKILLYKYLGGVDGYPICLDTKDPDKFIETVLLLQPSFGAINLEDIAQPKCFRILDTLRQEAEIPVWHDDQQGTATVVLAGLMNALKVVGKKKEEVSIAFVGSGASNVACSRLAFSWGVDPAKCFMIDSKGILGRHREDLYLRRHEFVDKWRLCQITNAEGRLGDIPEALLGTDVVIALSRPGPDTIRPEWVKSMAKDAIVFACANPVPEIWPWEAEAAGAAVVATGRSDFDNQVNNSLGFPGIFRGALDVRASTITDEMCFAAASALADHIEDKLSPSHILPTMDDWSVFAFEAAAVGTKAIETGVARVSLSYQELFENATRMIKRSHELTAMMMEKEFIAKCSV
jgi:malate dehydrogenase (oxaloacetate-decarboxylating)